MVLAIQIHISAVIPVEEIHTHRIGTWLTIIGFQGCIEQCASQHLPPPKRLQRVTIAWLNFGFLPSPKTGVFATARVHRVVSPEVEAVPPQNILPNRHRGYIDEYLQIQ